MGTIVRLVVVVYVQREALPNIIAKVGFVISLEPMPTMVWGEYQLQGG